MHRRHILLPAGPPMRRPQPGDPVTEARKQTAPPKDQVLVTSWLSPSFQWLLVSTWPEWAN